MFPFLRPLARFLARLCDTGSFGTHVGRCPIGITVGFVCGIGRMHTTVLTPDQATAYARHILRAVRDHVEGVPLGEPTNHEEE